MRGRAFGVTELEGDSDGPASIRPMTLRFVTAVGVDCDMVADENKDESGLANPSGKRQRPPYVGGANQDRRRKVAGSQ